MKVAREKTETCDFPPSMSGTSVYPRYVIIIVSPSDPEKQHRRPSDTVPGTDCEILTWKITILADPLFGFAWSMSNIPSDRQRAVEPEWNLIRACPELARDNGTFTPFGNHALRPPHPARNGLEFAPLRVVAKMQLHRLLNFSALFSGGPSAFLHAHQVNDPTQLFLSENANQPPTGSFYSRCPNIDSTSTRLKLAFPPATSSAA